MPATDCCGCSETAGFPDTLMPAPTAVRNGERAAAVITPHMPGLDLLRGVAILAVIFYHGFSFSAPRLALPNRPVAFLYHLTGWGWLGVNLFFIFSGFLITGLLQDSVGNEHYYRRFYIRRALRILPAYFATLLLIWILGFVHLPYILVCLFFFANVPGLFLAPGFAFYGPLWSLAVEEQFYLLWPMLQRRLARRTVLIICCALLLACPLLRWLLDRHLLFAGVPNSRTWMFADNLAMGAALALVVRMPRVSLRLFRAMGGWLMAVGAAGVLILASIHQLRGGLGTSLGVSCFLCLGAGAMIGALCLFRNRSVPRGLRFLLFFGEISYGLYLIHALCLMIYDRFAGEAPLHSPGGMVIRFLIANGVAIAIAVLSRRTFEQWFLGLKRRIPAAA
jgi:peptidoglycan/LPS O-acetylase OafA/YrhL